MSSYAVLWQKEGGQPMAGRLEFDPHGLWLHGGNNEQHVQVEIPFDEIISAHRDPSLRIGPCRAIRLTSRAAGSLLVATIAGAGTLGEILVRLQDALAAVG